MRNRLRAHTSNKEVEKIIKENGALNKKNEELQVHSEALKKEKSTANKSIECKDKEIARLEAKNTNLENENNNLKEELVVKENESKEILEDKMSLEEKINSLLDVLYGCPECGLNKCECGEAFMEEDSSSYLPPQCASTVEPSFPPSTTPSNTPAAPQPPTQSSSGSPPWTPPPTPPCISCGEANFGPCPSSVCFACIPPLQIKPESNNSSPSRTPPGTPP